MQRGKNWVLTNLFVRVDSCLQCNVCFEDFQLNESVRGLPCKHVFHGDCIVPWLQLVGYSFLSQVSHLSSSHLPVAFAVPLCWLIHPCLLRFKGTPILRTHYGVLVRVAWMCCSFEQMPFHFIITLGAQIKQYNLIVAEGRWCLVRSKCGIALDYIMRQRDTSPWALWSKGGR